MNNSVERELKFNPYKVSVIIPAYNCARYLSTALNSVINQTYKNCEIVLVDDGSTDNTKEVVNNYLYLKNFNYIFKKNGGLASARNTGIYNATGDFIAFLDADDYWSANKLEKQVAVFMDYPDVELVHSNMFIFDEGKENFQKYSFDINFNELPQEEIFKKLIFWEADILIPTVIVKKSIFKKIGYFDENLSYLGCEDRELWLRASRVCKFFFIDDYLSYYMQRKNSMTKNKLKMKEARKYVIEKTIKNSDFKDKKRIKRTIFSRLYLRIGLNCFRDRRRLCALLNLLISLYYDYTNQKSYIYSILCFFPDKFINLLKRYS